MIIDITAELAAYTSRENRFEEIAKEFKKATKKTVYADFSFPKCGKVMGIIRHILQNPKHSEKLMKIVKLSKGEVEFFRDNAGNTAYLSDGEVVKTREMDVERTQAIVRLIADKLKIELEDMDIENEINQERWKGISKLAEKKARKAKKLAEEMPTVIEIEE